MINIHDIDTKVQDIRKQNKDIMTEHIPKKLLEKFHTLIIECFKELDVVVKGSRALNQFLKYQIYSEEELFYVDYDIYSYNYKKDLQYIADYFKKNDMNFIRMRVLPFKADISRVSLYTVPMIDVEDMEKRYYDQLKYKTFNGIKYIHPEFYKIDLYSILSQPTFINMNVFEKAIKRLGLVESNYKYESTHTLDDTHILSEYHKYILSIVKKDSIIVGDYAFNTLFDKNITINYLEILTENIPYFINKLKRKYKNITFKKFKQFMYIMANYVVVYKDNEPILILWSLRNSTTYTLIDNKKYCSEYYLRFYYNFLTYFNTINNVFKDANYYQGLLKHVPLHKLPELTSYGNINYDAKEQLDNIRTKKRETFFIYNS
tara:strand:+ start:1522 stop:2646 length:1125 start_codon:yes stop_codon:yes gene_type:complete